MYNQFDNIIIRKKIIFVCLLTKGTSAKDSLILLIDCSKKMFEQENDSEQPIDLCFKVPTCSLSIIVIITGVCSEYYRGFYYT